MSFVSITDSSDSNSSYDSSSDGVEVLEDRDEYEPEKNEDKKEDQRKDNNSDSDTTASKNSSTNSSNSSGVRDAMTGKLLKEKKTNEVEKKEREVDDEDESDTSKDGRPSEKNTKRKKLDDDYDDGDIDHDLSNTNKKYEDVETSKKDEREDDEDSEGGSQGSDRGSEDKSTDSRNKARYDEDIRNGHDGKKDDHKDVHESDQKWLNDMTECEGTSQSSKITKNPFHEIHGLDKKIVKNEEFGFEDVDEDVESYEDSKSQLAIWWPTVAEKIMQAMYSTKDSKQSAVRLLMPLFEFKYKPVKPIKLVSDEVHSIHNLYKEKLKLIEDYTVAVKNEWCDNLRSCCSQCKSLFREKEKSIELLKIKAREMLTKANNTKVHPSTKNSMVMAIKDEYEKTLLMIEKDFTTSLQILKLSFKANKVNFREAAVADLNKKISMMTKNVSRSGNNTDWIQELRDAFESERHNIDHYISKQIQSECEEYWMESLR